MKKLVSVLLMILCLCSFLFGYQNTYRHSSEEVQTFLLLRKLTGSITPDPTFPVSESQLIELVDSLDTSGLSKDDLVIYNQLRNKLENRKVILKVKDSGLDFSFSILGLQTYLNNDFDTFAVLPFKDMMPMFNIVNEVYFDNFAYGYFNFNGIPKATSLPESKTYTYSLLNFASFANSFPDRCYLSLGYKNINFIIGRDRLGAGNGYTGNLELGENSFYEDFAKLSLASEKFSYDFTLSSFEDEKNTFSTQKRNKKTIFFHRASFDICDKVSLTGFEGALMYGETPFVDLRLLNPFMILHQTFLFEDGSQNNFFGAELVAELPFGIQLDSQLFIDQLVIEDEDPVSSGDDAYMALLNLSKIQKAGNGLLDVYAEGIYGNPYVYLKNSHGYGFNPTTGKLEDGSGLPVKEYCEHIDLVIDPFVIFNSTPRDKQYMGYKYGGNLCSIAVGANYYGNNYKVLFNLQYLSKGIYGIREGEIRDCEGYDGEKNVHQNSLIAQLNFDMTLFEGIDFDLRVAYLNNFNYLHVPGVEKNEFKFSLGININLLEFLNYMNLRKTL